MADTREFDVVIIGGGPAGLACGQYSSRAGRKTALVEEMACGGQAAIIDEVENYPGMGKTGGWEIASKFEEQAAAFGTEFIYTTVSAIKPLEDGRFDIETAEGTLKASAVVIATGAKHRNLEVPGEKEYKGHGVSYCATCDGPFFKGRKILVCGGGDAACQEAMYLAKLTDKVTVCHRRDRFRAQASIVSAMETNPAISTKMNHTVVSINGENGKVTSVTFLDKDTGKEYTEAFDAVFVFVGTVPQTQLVPFCETDASGSIVTDSCMRTSVKGIFAAGDVRNTPFRQIVTAAADGATAAHYASEYVDEIRGNVYAGLAK